VKEITGGNVERGDNYVEDPSGLRTGNPPDEKMAEILNREVRALKEYIHKNQVQNQVALTLPEITEKINNVRGAVTMAYPMGLPEWDLAHLALDGSVDKLKVKHQFNPLQNISLIVIL